MSDYLQHLVESVNPGPSPKGVRPALPSRFESTPPSEENAVPRPPSLTGRSAAQEQTEAIPQRTSQEPIPNRSTADHLAAVQRLSAKASNSLLPASGTTPIPPTRFSSMAESLSGVTRAEREPRSPVPNDVSPPLATARPTGQRTPAAGVVPHVPEVIPFPPRVPLQPTRGQAQRPATTASSSSPRTAPTIQITIGRIEVRAVNSRESAPPKAPSAKPSGPAVSLDDYLRKRKGGAA